MNYSEVEQMRNSEAGIDSEYTFSQESGPTSTIHICRAIITSLILAVFQDIQKHPFATVNTQELGWRNKYNIHLLSGISQKQIYKECGILEKLITEGILEKRPSQSKWGRQKHQYRLSFSYLL